MSEQDLSARGQTVVCPECGHQGSLHRSDGCSAIVLGRADRSRDCACTLQARDVLRPPRSAPPAEIAEREMRSS